MAIQEGWQLRRRTARFRGVEIFLFSSERSGGRRLDVHTFAFRDVPYAEDLGRTPRTFTVRGAVIGADHDLDAERLEAAFEASGPGELVLPHRAPIMVAVASYRFEEPDRTERMQAFEAEFVEAGLAVSPTPRTNTAGVVESKADAAIAAAKARFAKVFTLEGETGAAVKRIATVAKSAASAVSTAFDFLKAGQAATEEIADYARQVDQFKRDVAGSIVDAAAMAGTLQDRLDDLLSLPLAPLNVYKRLADVVTFGDNLASPGLETNARRSFVRNQTALTSLVGQTASMVRARALSRVTFESSTDAAELRDEIAAELSEAILDASDAFADEQVAALRALRTAVIRDLDVRSARLPARIVYTVPNQVPALVIAQRLYGDSTREAEIVSRNRRLIRHPGRVPYGAALEVLADG